MIMGCVNNKIVLWAVDDYNALGLLRQLKDCDVFFLIRGKAKYAAKSAFCKEYVETPSTQYGFDYLQSHFRENDHLTILLTSSDAVAVFINEHKDELSRFFILPGTIGSGDQKKYTDKNNMTGLAEEIGIVCPKSQKVKWNSNIDNISFPCIIKPSHQTPGHYNEFKYKICKDKESLDSVLKIVRHESEFILQQFIDTEKIGLVYGGRMRDGNTVIAGILMKDRFSDTGDGTHGYLSPEIPQSIYCDKIDEFLKRIDYYGLFSFEYAMKDGKAYFLEVNLRNDGTSHLFYQAGANIPLAYAYSCAGLDYSGVPTKVLSEKTFIDELFDFENVLHNKISFKQWKSDKKSANVFKYYDEHDTKPWLYLRKRVSLIMARNIVLKKVRPYYVYLVDKIR